MSAVQLRIDGAAGYGLPLNPAALPELNLFEVGHILACLRLDEEQTAAAEAAVALAREGRYPTGGKAAA
jgi:hypothetical protein